MDFFRLASRCSQAVRLIARSTNRALAGMEADIYRDALRDDPWDKIKGFLPDRSRWPRLTGRRELV